METFEEVCAHWNDIFWRLNYKFPNNPKFSPEHFGDCLVIEVEQALRYIARFELELEAHIGTPISIGFYSVVKSLVDSKHSSSIKLEHFNPAGRQLQSLRAKEKINEQVAALFMELVKAGKVPSWVIARCDMDLIKLASE